MNKRLGYFKKRELFLFELLFLFFFKHIRSARVKRKMIVKSTLFLLGASLINIVVVMAEKFTPSDLIQLPRPGIPVTSPSGALAVYAQSAYNITEAKVSFINTNRVHIFNTFFHRLSVIFTF